MIKGIDVAKWQGNIDWPKVKASGVQFAILKIINKSGKVEESFEKNYNGAVACGIPVGVYNYSYATTEAKAKADAIKVVSILNHRSVPYKVWLDVEDECMKNLGATLVRIINEYQSIVQSYGYEFGVYTGLSFYNSYLKKYAQHFKCDFWIARYPSTKQMDLSMDANATKKPCIPNNLWGWQYSSNGKVPGINAKTDLDICYVVNTAVAPISTTIYFPKYKGTSSSITAALNSLGITSALAYRKQIGKANGITLVGTSSGNTTMLNMLKKGTLKRP